MKTPIRLINHGRGLQLLKSRVTVQDLVPYLQEGCSAPEIMRWIPAITREEIEIVERYYRAHQAKLDEEGRKSLAYVDGQVRLQRLRFPEEPREVRLARMKEVLRKRKQERNGEENLAQEGGR